MAAHQPGTREQWAVAYAELRAEEKDLTRRNAALVRKRQALPWVPVEKDYRFETKRRREDTCGAVRRALTTDRAALHACPQDARRLSTYDRGTEALNATWQLLDRAPKGRGENFDGWPRKRDEYVAAP
jgi:predicted dithiol-disulfide oxidoreductase (DUF899 family)